MSKRQLAPGRMEVVRAFVNTLDIERAEDQLRTPAALTKFLGAHHLGALTAAEVTTSELARALALREALRAVLMAHNEGTEADPAAVLVLDGAAIRAEIALRFPSAGTATLEPRAGGVDGALGQLLTIVAKAIADGNWVRLKACRSHDCQWAFYDATRNRSGAWCNMQVCGNRAKARAFRDRRAG